MKTLTWFDRLLVKIALAKSAARQTTSIRLLAADLIEAFQGVNAESSDISRSVGPEEHK